MPNRDPGELVDAFIRQWVAPAMHAHLLDNDENDGERLRRVVSAAVERAEKAERERDEALTEVEGAVWRLGKANERGDNLLARAMTAEDQVAKVRMLAYQWRTYDGPLWSERRAHGNALDAALGSVGATEGEGEVCWCGHDAAGHASIDGQPGCLNCRECKAFEPASPAAAEPERLRERMWDAIRSVYHRHDSNLPLNHVNTVEWVDAVLAVLAPAECTRADERDDSPRALLDECNRRGDCPAELHLSDCLSRTNHPARRWVCTDPRCGPRRHGHDGVRPDVHPDTPPPPTPTESAAPLECGPQPCEACGGSGEVQFGFERDTNSAVTRTCDRCDGTGEGVTAPPTEPAGEPT